MDSRFLKARGPIAMTFPTWVFHFSVSLVSCGIKIPADETFSLTARKQG
jgi:hypothetical protein